MLIPFNFASVSIVSVLLLIALNLFWTFQLLDSGQCQSGLNKNLSKGSAHLENINCPQSSPSIISTTDTPLQSPKSTNQFSLAFDNVNFKLGRWDNQHLYKIYDFTLVGDTFEEASADSIVCLATQSSLERLNSLAQVAHHWNGPISVAVFVAGSEEFSILQYYVTYLRLCYNSIRNNVTFHIAVPRAQQPDHGAARNGDGGLVDKFDCQFPEQTLRRLLSMRTTDTLRWRLKNEYPQNHMRNLARKGCQSKFVFLTDIDIIPSANIVPLLNSFLSTVKCVGRCAYVIPTFEIDIRAKFPATKLELLRLTKKGLARPFHEKVFIYNQYATNFSSWLSNTQSYEEIYISHVVSNFEFLYEPFYVALDTIPIHDERFLGYGFTRNSQVYEMYVAGYSFYVLSPVFTCHWGLQQKKTRPAWREQQNNMNRKRFETFKSEIFARYKNDPLLMFSSHKKNS